MALTCEIHVKYTCQVPDNSLVVFGIPKNPYFDSSHVYIASFLKILLHNANAAFFLGHPVLYIDNWICHPHPTLIKFDWAKYSYFMKICKNENKRFFQTLLTKTCLKSFIKICVILLVQKHFMQTRGMLLNENLKRNNKIYNYA